jgi:flagellar FliL protein
MAAKAKEPEVESEEEGSGKPAKKKLPIKLIAMVVGVLVVLGGGGYGAFALLHHKEPPPTAAVAKPAVFFDVPEVLVNLSSANTDRTQYLKVKVVLELSDPKLKELIQPVLPRLTDTFQTYLRELRPTDLDGSAGLYRLKEELTRRVNASIAPNRVNAVLFKEIVVQ